MKINLDIPEVVAVDNWMRSRDLKVYVFRKFKILDGRDIYSFFATGKLSPTPKARLYIFTGLEVLKPVTPGEQNAHKKVKRRITVKPYEIMQAESSAKNSANQSKPDIVADEDKPVINQTLILKLFSEHIKRTNLALANIVHLVAEQKFSVSDLLLAGLDPSPAESDKVRFMITAADFTILDIKFTDQEIFDTLDLVKLSISIVEEIRRRLNLQAQSKYPEDRKKFLDILARQIDELFLSFLAVKHEIPANMLEWAEQQRQTFNYKE